MRHEHPDPAVATESPGEDAAEMRSRRAFIKAGSLGVTSAALVAAGAAPATQAAAGVSHSNAPLALTPACTGHETPPIMEGPLFKPESPHRTDFVTPAVATGVCLNLSGLVHDTGCAPVPGALVEFWQCDQNGDYDTEGFSLRGHQFAADDGTYRLHTIIPRDYNGRWGQRAPHIHAKVQAPGGPVLTTQLFFPDDTTAYGRDFATLNARDRLINRACTVELGELGRNGYAGTFSFVITTEVPSSTAR